MKRNRAFSVLYMFLITLFFGTVVSIVYGLNQDRIETNDRIKLEGIILKVLNISVPPGVEGQGVLELFKNRVKTVQLESGPVYIGKSDHGAGTVGYAFQLSGPGFWGPIHGMMGLGPDLREVLGVAFYKHSETPGLGGRISESWFTEQFKGKMLPSSPAPDEVFFRLRPPEAVKGANEVDAVTGATGTSKAVERLINASIHRVLPQLAELSGKRIGSK